MAERSFMGSAPVFGGGSTPSDNQDATTQQVTNESNRPPSETHPQTLGLRKLFKTVSNSVTGTSDSSTDNAIGDDGSETNGKLPLWPTMALFASLAANLFFGWIAWDTHSKYQTFVEEISEAETDRERRTRRLRDEPRPSIATRRRMREEDEADFLSGGIEV